MTVDDFRLLSDREKFRYIDNFLNGGKIHRLCELKEKLEKLGIKVYYEDIYNKYGVKTESKTTKQDALKQLNSIKRELRHPIFTILTYSILMWLFLLEIMWVVYIIAYFLPQFFSWHPPVSFKQSSCIVLIIHCTLALVITCISYCSGRDSQAIALEQAPPLIDEFFIIKEVYDEQEMILDRCLPDDLEGYISSRRCSVHTRAWIVFDIWKNGYVATWEIENEYEEDECSFEECCRYASETSLRRRELDAEERAEALRESDSTFGDSDDESEEHGDIFMDVLDTLRDSFVVAEEADALKRGDLFENGWIRDGDEMYNPSGRGDAIYPGERRKINLDGGFVEDERGTLHSPEFDWFSDN